MVVDHELLPIFREAQLAEVTHQVVQEWVNGLATRLAPSSVQRSFTVLRQVLDFAVDTRAERQPVGSDTSPASTIERRSRAMVLVMAWGTLRIGESTGLRRSDLDLHRGRLRIANNLVEVAGKLHEGPPKTKAGRRSMTLPLSIVTELRLHLTRFGGSPYVFTMSDHELLHAEDWRTTVWRPAVAAAGLAPLRPHDLKHTGVALLAAAGVDPMEIARRAGHSTVAFTYDGRGHLFPEADTGAAAKLDSIRTRRLRTATASGDGEASDVIGGAVIHP